MKKISIIIPYFNRSQTIERCLKSVINQTFSDWECLIIDDGSSSEESKSLQESLYKFNDGRISIIKHDENKGGGAARNTGIESSSGEIIAFLDSDDEWLSSKLDAQITELGSKGPVFSYCQSIVMHERGKSILPQTPIKDFAIADYLFVQNGWIPTPSIAIKRKTLGAIRFNESLPRHQDYDLIFQLETYGIQPRLLNKTLVVVHWEDIDTSGRAINISNSEYFLELHSRSFSKNAKACFHAANIVIPTIRLKGRIAGLKKLKRDFWRILKNRNLSLNSLSMFIFKDQRLLRYAASVIEKLS